MIEDILHNVFKINRMKSRFDDGTSVDDGEKNDGRKIKFKRFLTAKRKTSVIRLIVLFAAALWAYYYFTNIK